MSSNDPKVLVEFSPEEITWLADLLHNHYWQQSALKAACFDKKDVAEKAQDNQKMNSNLRNRILDKASDQGFGDL